MLRIWSSVTLHIPNTLAIHYSAGAFSLYSGHTYANYHHVTVGLSLAVALARTSQYRFYYRPEFEKYLD